MIDSDVKLIHDLEAATTRCRGDIEDGIRRIFPPFYADMHAVVGPSPPPHARSGMGEARETIARS